PLLRPGGALVYFASVAALPGNHGATMSAYTAAKAGVIAFMRAVAEEEREAGVRANALAPSAIRTAANLASMGADARYVEREDVARVVAWLCSEESRSVTGQVVQL
ncbi:MAG TPA: SDR family oxidoreductase, partial [Gemmatimonadaceae bacterium]|nr:SDR family oxidoreductase [Gemmatimonadaceae bacterium]